MRLAQDDSSVRPRRLARPGNSDARSHPNVQTLSIQGLLLSGAALGLVYADGPAEGRGQGQVRGFGKDKETPTCQALGGSADHDPDRRRGGVAPRTELEPVDSAPTLDGRAAGAQPAPVPAAAAKPADLPFREYPIGDEVLKNQTRIAAVWLPPIAMEGMPALPAGR